MKKEPKTDEGIELLEKSIRRTLDKMNLNESQREAIVEGVKKKYKRALLSRGCLVVERSPLGVYQLTREVYGGKRAHEAQVEGAKVRVKWEKIKEIYSILRKCGFTVDEISYTLSKRYSYSPKTIEAIIYCR